MTPITVFLADDQELVRSGFRMLIEAEEDLRVVGEAADGAATVTGVLRTQCDVVLMDIRMPVMDGVDATRKIVASGVRTRVLVLTTFDLDEYVFSALKAGASGFMLKDARPADLLNAIRTVAAGEAVMAPSATTRGSTCSPSASGRCSSRSPPAPPTPRSPEGSIWPRAR
jgi:DNA-binding NarL/FixJ family response regulator